MTNKSTHTRTHIQLFIHASTRHSIPANTRSLLWNAMATPGPERASPQPRPAIPRRPRAQLPQDVPRARRPEAVDEENLVTVIISAILIPTDGY